MTIMEKFQSRVGFCEEMILLNFLCPNGHRSVYSQPLTYWTKELRLAEQRVVDYVLEKMGAAP